MSYLNWAPLWATMWNLTWSRLQKVLEVLTWSSIYPIKCSDWAFQDNQSVEVAFLSCAISWSHRLEDLSVTVYHCPFPSHSFSSGTSLLKIPETTLKGAFTLKPDSVAFCLADAPKQLVVRIRTVHTEIAMWKTQVRNATAPLSIDTWLISTFVQRTWCKMFLCKSAGVWPFHR